MAVVDGSSRRLIAPFPDGEHVWLAVICSGNIAVTARHAAGGSIPIAQAIVPQDRKMIVFADIGREELRPSVEDCTPPSPDLARTGRFHIAVTITSDLAETSIEVLFVATDLFRSMTGIDVPSTDPSDGYDGWLLP